MKVPAEVYAAIRAAIGTIADNMPRMRADIVEEDKAHDVEKRLRWDCLRRTVPRQTILRLYDEFGCDDTHIDTALRQVMRDLPYRIPGADGLPDAPAMGGPGR